MSEPGYQIRIEIDSVLQKVTEAAVDLFAIYSVFAAIVAQPFPEVERVVWPDLVAIEAGVEMEV